MENYEAAKKDFAVRAGLVESQRLFSDEQLAVIRNACEFALEDGATLSYAEEKQLHSVQEQIEVLSAAADAGAAPNNGTDNVIFAESRDFVWKSRLFCVQGGIS